VVSKKSRASDRSALVEHPDVVAVQERKSEGDDDRGEDEVDIESFSLYNTSFLPQQSHHFPRQETVVNSANCNCDEN